MSFNLKKKQLELYLTVDKPAVPKHSVTVDKAHLAMIELTEVVQDFMSSSIRTPNSSLKNINLNQVNQVIYEIKRLMEQADLSRYRKGIE